MEVTCNELWREWMIADYSNPLVIEGKSRITVYSKNDWKTMSDEATDVVNNLGYLVKNNIPVDNDLAKKAFYDLILHLETWFFKPNSFFLFDLAIASGNKESKYSTFFNQFQPGLADYMLKLIFTHHKTI
jgi:hypothetical protein